VPQPATAVFDSTAIERAAYDPDRRVLDLWYVGGDRYSYFGVPAEVYQRLLAAPSAGAFVNIEIKPGYRHEIEPRRRRFRPD
jgi:hypothetical protein